MSNPVQIVDNLALVPLTASEVASLNLQSLGVVTIVSPNAPGAMLESQFATINPGAGYVDKAISAQQVPYTGLTGLPGNQTLFLRADGTFAAPPGQTYTVVTTAGPGLVPTLPSSSGFNYLLGGDGGWKQIAGPQGIHIPYGQLDNVPLKFAPDFHHLQHVTGGNDVIPSATAATSGLVPILPPSFQTLNFLRGDGQWAQVPLTNTAQAGLIPALPPLASVPPPTSLFFRGDGNYAQADWTNLANKPNQFDPIPHANRHVTAGIDLIPNFLIGGSVPGLVPGSPGPDTTKFLRADGQWSAPTGQGSLADATAAGLLNILKPLPVQNQSLYYLRGDNNWDFISNLSIDFSKVTNVPIFIGGSPGLVPISSGGPGAFLRNDGVFSVPPGSNPVSPTTPGTVAALPATNQTTYYLRGDDQWRAASEISALLIYANIPGTPTALFPTAHAPTHITPGGSDPIGPATTAHNGLVPVLPTANASTSYLNGNSQFAQIPIAAPGQPGLVPTPTNLGARYLNDSAAFQAIPLATSSAPGLVPILTMSTQNFFRADGQYIQVDWTNLSGRPGQFDPIPHSGRHISTGVDPIAPFTPTVTGLVPVGGSNTTFLRGDGQWVIPTGAGDVSHTLQIITPNSVRAGQGQVSAGSTVQTLAANVTLQLDGDVATPGNWQIYSTDGSGIRSWHASSAFPVAVTGTPGLVAPTGSQTTFLRGDGQFQTPPSYTGSTPGYVPAVGAAGTFLRTDGQWVVPPNPVATTGNAGIVPQLLGNTSANFLRGDNQWAPINGIQVTWSQISVTGTVPIYAGGAAGLVSGNVGPAGTASQFLGLDGSFHVPPLAASGAPGYIAGLPAPNATAYWARGDNSWQIPPTAVLVTSQWNMPPVGNPVTVSVLSSTGFLPGMTVVTGNPTFPCFMEVTGVGTGTVTLLNRGYAINPIAPQQIPGGLMFIASPAIMTGSTVGLVPPGMNNDATKFLNGAGGWTTPVPVAGSINTAFSIVGDGSVGSPLKLKNDSVPGSFYYYSTDANSNIGWFPLTFSWETSAQFFLPIVGGAVTISFTNVVGMTAGTTLVIEDNNVPANLAFVEVVTVNGAPTNTALVRNPGYAMNSPGGITQFNASASVTLAGPGVASATAPGFVPTPTGNTNQFLAGNSQFLTPAIFTTAAPGYVPIAPVGDTTKFLCANPVSGTNWVTPSAGALVTTTTQGTVNPIPASSQTNYYLRGDDQWRLASEISALLIYANIPGIPTSSLFPPLAHASTHITAGQDLIANFSLVSTTPGLVPGSNNASTFFLRGDGTWASAPTGPGRAVFGADGLVPGLFSASTPTNQTYYLQGDNTWAQKSLLSINYSQLTGTVPFAALTHGSTHLDAAGGGTDPIPVVAGLRTGLVPILPASAPSSKFLRGDATWTVVPTVINGVDGLIPGTGFDGTPTKYFNASGTYTPIATATATTAGLVPAPPNNTTRWFRGDATFTTLPLTWNITAGFTQPSPGVASGPVTFTSTTGLVGAVGANPGTTIATIDSGNVTNYYSVGSVNVDGIHATLINTGALGNTAAASTVNPGIVNLCGPPIMTATGAGIVPVPPNIATQYLDGTGHFSTPPSTGVPSSRQVNTQNSLEGGGDLSTNRTLDLVGDTATPPDWSVYSINGSTHLRSWNPSTAFPVATTSANGLAPQLPTVNPTLVFLRGDGSYAAPSSIGLATNAGPGTVPALPAVPPAFPTQFQWLRADNTWVFGWDSNATSASWQMPAVGTDVTAVTFQSTANFAVGDTLFFATGSAATNCFMEVMSIAGNQATLRNRGYLINPISTTTIPSCQVLVAGPGIASYNPVGPVAAAGLVPLPPGTTNTFLRGDATFVQVDYSNLSNPPVLPFSTTTNGSFPQPSVGSPATIPVLDDGGLVIGRGLWVSGSGYYNVTSSNHNPPNSTITGTLTGFQYASGVTSGSTITSGKAVITTGPCNLFSSTSAGATPLSGGGTTNFLRADGTWAQPPGLVPTTRQIATTNSLRGGGDLSADRTLDLQGDAAAPGNWFLYSTNGSGTKGWNAATALPQATATVAGLVPTPPNDTTKWLRGDATWQVSPPLTQTVTSTFNWPAVGATSTSISVASSSLLMVGTSVYIPALGVAEVMSVGTGTMTIRNNGNSGNAGATSNVAIGTPIYSSGAGSRATSTTSGMIPIPPGIQTPSNPNQFLRGDATFAVPDTASWSGSVGLSGYVPTPTGSTANFLRADATWALPIRNTNTAFVDFGTADNGGADTVTATTTVAASWLTSTSAPTVSMCTGQDHTDADDILVEELWCYVANLVVAASFDIIVVAPNGAQGKYQVNYMSS